MSWAVQNIPQQQQQWELKSGLQHRARPASWSVCSTKVGLCSTKVGLCSTKVGLCSTNVDLCSIKVDLCSTKIGLCSTKVGLCSTKVDLCSIKVDLCSTKPLLSEDLQHGGSVALSPLAPLCSSLFTQFQSNLMSVIQRWRAVSTQSCQWNPSWNERSAYVWPLEKLNIVEVLTHVDFGGLSK